MARARKSHVTDEEDMKTRELRIQPAYSPRVDGHKYVIYCSYKKEGAEYSQSLVLKFLAKYAARYFVMKLVGNDEFWWDKWLDRDEMIVTKNGIKIHASGTQLKEICDYEPTEEELEWGDPQIIASINRFKYAREDTPYKYANDDGGELDESARDTKPSHTPKSKREKVIREPKVKVDKTGLVSANDIAKELGVEGREVRGVLRSMKLEKPAGGWLFDKKTAEDIKDKVKKGLKEGKKK